MVGLLLIGALPAAAQGGPGQGGIIIEGNFGSDPATFNPIICTDTACRTITRFLFPVLIGVDPVTAGLASAGENDMVRNALATGWTFSEDGLTLTVNMRNDYKWSDGAPLTANDYVYAYDAVMSGVVDTNLGYVGDVFSGVVAVDDYTLEFTLHQPDCNALLYASYVPPMPAHALPADFAEINDSPWNMDPQVAAGPFLFGQFRPGELTSVVANPDYPDAELGYVSAQGFIYKVVLDQTVLVEQFLAGETNLITNPAVNRRSDIRAAGTAGEAQVYNYPGDAWDYFAFNLADPTNPQNGLDENGNVVDQGNHPLFGDVAVRQAIAHAVDVDTIIDGAVFGEGSRMTSSVIPASWAYNHDLPPITYDVELAKQMLADAGWRDEDGDGVLEAHGAKYAEDGAPFAFTLYTNEGNTRRAAIGTIIQDELRQVGISVDFQSIDFNTLLDVMDNQTYDAVILGWRNGYPDDPDLTQLFALSSDIVGSGDNFTSYSNPELMELMQQARTVPGCALEDRAELYRQVQVIMQQDLPYLWLFTQDGMYAARSNVEGWDPYPANWYWNVDAFTVMP